MSNNSKSRVPTLGGEELYIPFVGAIIERTVGGKTQIVVQTRKKAHESKYNDVIEIPGGKFRAFENIYDTLKREVKEETGLNLTNIKDRDKTITHTNRQDHSEIVYPYCVTQMKEGPFIGMIFLCEAEGNLAIKTNESKDIRWADISEVKDIVKKTPESIYTAFLAPLKLYLNI